MPQIFIVNQFIKPIYSMTKYFKLFTKFRSNSVEGQMSKSLEGQIPQIVNSNYLCMVICCEGQGQLKVKVG